MRWASEPVSMEPPRADWASTMARVSSVSVGMNRNARLMTSAISWAWIPSRLSGLIKVAKASVMAVGVVVVRNTAPRMITNAKRQAYSTAMVTP